jgi:hypothetical protein
MAKRGTDYPNKHALPSSTTAVSILWRIRCEVGHSYSYINHYCSTLYDLRSNFGSPHQEECPPIRSISDRDCGMPSHRYAVAPTCVFEAAVCALKAHLIFITNKP